MPNQESKILFTGTSHFPFGEKIASCLGSELGKLDVFTFPDGEIGVRVLENVRGRDVFIVQTIARNPNFYLMELLILIDAMKRASAKSITAVVPYFGYSRQDRKDHGREPITARLVANMLETAGIDRLLTMDLHAAQIEGFFNVPVDNLLAAPMLAKAIKEEIKEDFVVVAPDIGSIKIAKHFAEMLQKDFVIVNKKRLDAEHVVYDALIGDIKGRCALLVDDMSVTGQTLVQAAKCCTEHGAKSVHAAVTHFLNPLSQDLCDSIETLFVCDTTGMESSSSQVKIVSVAQVFSEAIQKVVKAGSISSMFK